jgi:adenine phosphoribosyltransferase
MSKIAGKSLVVEDASFVMPELRALALIRDVPDFPKPGIVFKDITPVLADFEAMREVIARLAEFARTVAPDVIVGVESRGFVFGMPLALELGIGFVPVRKVGKLPWNTISEEYALEYGTNILEIHEDSIQPGMRALVIDDLLATGGTARASINLVERLGGKVCALAFMVELGFLHGRKTLEDYEICSLIQFD